MILVSTLYSSFLLVSLLFTESSSANECQRRSFGGKDDIVCVCNSAYCDDLVLPDFGQGSVLLVESSKDGKRFKTSQVNFTSINEKPSVSLKTWDLFINTSKKYQTMIGFGGAFTDAAGFNIVALSEDLQRQLIEGYFGPNGIGYNVMRIPIGGTDMSTRPYALQDVDNDFEMNNFSLAEEDLKYKIPFIKLANQVSPQEIFLFGSSWSPPAWMKTNQMLNGSGTLLGPVGGKYYDAYARYHIKWLQEYEKRGAKMWGLTPQNEPLTGFFPNYRWNTLGMDAGMERDYIKLNLGPALKKAGFQDLKLMAYDFNIDSILDFSTTVLEDKAAADYVSGIGLHWYANNQNLYQRLDILRERFPEKFILATEACYIGGNPVVAYGDWSRGEGYAKDILKDLNHGVSGWVEWNLALDGNGGPSWIADYLDSTIIVNATGNEYYKNPMFYVMGHFSKFVKRNSARVDVQTRGSPVSEDLQVVSVVTPENEVVIVALNPLEEDINLSIGDDRLHKIIINLAARSIVTAVYKL